MSLEQKIDALTAAVVALTAKLEGHTVTSHAPVTQATVTIPVFTEQTVAAVPTHAAIPTAAAPAPTIAAAPAPVTASPSNMPAPPVFAAPAPAAPPAACPITDGKSLIDYVMTAYKQMGPVKGAGIQNVLTGLGYANINDVKPEHYPVLFAGVEALK